MTTETTINLAALSAHQRETLALRVKAVQLSDQYPAKAIAEIVGRDRRTVYRWLKAWRGGRDGHAARHQEYLARRTKARMLADRGFTTAQIAEELQCCTNTVRSYLRDYPVATRPDPHC